MNGRTPSVGEIITFVQPDAGRLLVHCVIARVGAGWFVRGDNCLKVDGIVACKNMAGCVTRMERQRVRCTGLGAEH